MGLLLELVLVPLAELVLHALIAAFAFLADRISTLVRNGWQLIKAVRRINNRVSSTPQPLSTGPRMIALQTDWFRSPTLLAQAVSSLQSGHDETTRKMLEFAENDLQQGLDSPDATLVAELAFEIDEEPEKLHSLLAASSTLVKTKASPSLRDIMNVVEDRRRTEKNDEAGLQWTPHLVLDFFPVAIYDPNLQTAHRHYFFGLDRARAGRATNARRRFKRSIAAAPGSLFAKLSEHQLVKLSTSTGPYR